MGKAKQDIQSTLSRKASRKEGVRQSGERALFLGWALSFIGCVFLSKLLNSSVLHFPHLLDGKITYLHHRIIMRDKWVIV